MKTILCFGDSNTWGYIPGTGQRYSYEKRWTGRLQSELGDNFRVIEEGLNGRTTVWDEPFRPGRNGRRFLKPILESHAPIDLLVIFLGTNDLKHFYNATAFDSARGIQTLVSITRHSGTGPQGKDPAILVVVPPIIRQLSEVMQLQYMGATQKSEQFAEAFLEICEFEGCFFLDTTQIIECSPVDGIHLEEDAHQILAGALENRVKDILRG